MSLENNLKQLGLEEKEAKVYLAALELGPTNIQNLAKKSEIKRSTLYEIIRNLKEQDLLTESPKGKRKIFIAAEPENLKRSIKLKEQLLNDILPELKSLNNIGFVKPKITFYEGREGFQKIYLDSLETKEKSICAIAPSKLIVDIVGEDFSNKYVEERAKRKIQTKLIHITSNATRYKYLDPKSFPKTLRSVRFTPSELVFNNAIVIYGNSVAIMSNKKEGFGFVVESADYAQTMRVFYDLLWNISKPWHDMNFDEQNKNTENEEDKGKEDGADNYWV